MIPKGRSNFSPPRGMEAEAPYPFFSLLGEGGGEIIYFLWRINEL
jgi:hypothetical protein